MSAAQNVDRFWVPVLDQVSRRNTGWDSDPTILMGHIAGQYSELLASERHHSSEPGTELWTKAIDPHIVAVAAAVTGSDQTSWAPKSPFQAVLV